MSEQNINAETIRQEMSGLDQAGRFPVEVFPEAIQEIITETNECLNYPIDFIGASILYAISVSIGNTHRAEIIREYEQTAVLYIAIVGKPGTTKSHPLSWAVKPIVKQDNIKFQEYKRKLQEFEMIASLPKAEREKQGYSDPVKPVWEQFLISDITPEALVSVHSFNKRGLGVYVDELASWFKNFNRYNKGSEQEFWLSVWSGNAVRVNRKTSEQYNIPSPFISVAGTIQPGILNELASQRTENGFLDRLLFVFPDNQKKEYLSEKEFPQRISENWEKIISNILNDPLIQDDIDNPQPKKLAFTPDAKKCFMQWQKELTDQTNRPENSAIRGINAKMEMYAIRLALILEIMRFACNESDKQAIGLEATTGAFKLVEYFKAAAIKVHSILSSASPVDKMPEDKQRIYSELPEGIFTTAEGVKIATGMGMAERTFKAFLTDRELFDYPERGKYEKRF